MWNSQRGLRIAAALIGTVLAVGACSSSSASDSAPEDGDGNGNARAVRTASPAADYDPASSSPPNVVLQRGDEQLSITPFSYCWTPEDRDEGICADGEAPTDPPVLAGNGPIEVYFPIDDFSFESRFWDTAYTTERAGPSLTAVGDYWQLDPPDELPAIVELFGFSDSNDVIISFLLEP